MNLRLISSAALLSLTMATNSHVAQAIPIQLTETQFSAGIDGLITVVDDFQSYSPGIKSNPFTFANGTFTTNALHPVVLGSGFCGASSILDQCLLVNDEVTDVRTFDALPARTVYWGVDMHYINPADTINVTVTGRSGVLNVQTVGSYFYGFFDSSGLTSIVINNLGVVFTNGHGWSNYSFDNITTASSVPEPGILLLICTGLFGLLVVRIKAFS
ncbi:MAG: PEP-CTERM sorting domain-containing protein [Gammaproteobacteria bacterium]|nr:PEP-CTERM sorting domain-containing protein [Gammaproteobacteria bacterium]